MNLRRVQSPEERPGTNTSIGRINVLDQQSQFVEKTDRSGFIEDGAFRELLRTFARDATDWMAKCRLAEAERRRRHARTSGPKRSGKARELMTSAIGAVSPKTRTGIEKAFSSYESSRDREVDQLKKEVQLYRTLSTAGITAATFAHESNANPVKIVSQSIAAIERRAKQHIGALYGEHFKRPIDGIKRAVFSIGRGRYATPNPDTVAVLRLTLPTARVICTQLSEHCSHQLPGHSPTHLSQAFARGRASGACCGRTVVVPLDDFAAILPEPAPHREFIRTHAQTALCSTRSADICED